MGVRGGPRDGRVQGGKNRGPEARLWGAKLGGEGIDFEEANEEVVVEGEPGVLGVFIGGGLGETLQPWSSRDLTTCVSALA